KDVTINFMTESSINYQLINAIQGGGVAGLQALFKGGTTNLKDGLQAFLQGGLTGAQEKVEREKILDSGNVKAGDVIIALPSSGVHSNGFSLVRKIFAGHDMNQYVTELGRTLGEELLTPTKIYVREVLSIIPNVKSIAHITGGGFYENIPRAIPDKLTAKIELAKIKTPAIFDLIMKTGNLERDEMFHVFNMGVGMTLIAAPENADLIIHGITGSYIIGEIVNQEGGILLC
ncbi:MAG: hypothetical protein IJQ56_11280, partial [Synergistaceae bacterium]|nr:hypothetical protein [Synergistaceae bacterium]